MNLLKLKIIIFVAFLNCVSTLAQELPLIKKFSPSDYNAENQNWSISQSPEKLIYVANNQGLLEFNGSKWKLYPSPNETVMRSVQVVNDRIYTGCFMEFGYWKKNDLGVLSYTSISKKLSLKLIVDEEFWNIINIDEWVVFQSLKRIYIYNVQDGSVNTIDSNSVLTKIFKVNKHIYFQRMGEGIFKIENGKDFLVFDDEVVRNNEVINIFGDGKEWLILTRDNGFYSSGKKSLEEWNVVTNKLLSKVSVYDAIKLKDNSFALGTISHGLIYLNKKGELLYNINQNKVLSNNTVLSLFEDADNNIWLGLDNGISYINMNSPFMEYNDSKGVLGSVYTSVINNGKLYLGTNQGLFYKNLKSKDDFTFIDKTQGQVWCLKLIDQTLFCGHDSGTFIIEGNQGKKISNVKGTWGVAIIENKPNYLLQGNYDGLYVLEKLNNTWKLKNKIKGFDNSSRYFETVGNEIFVNHEYNGVFKLKVDSTFSKVKNISIDTLIKGYNSGIIKYKENLLYSYKKGVFNYDRVQNRFSKDSLLSRLYTEKEYVSGKLILDDKDNDLWVFTNSSISFMSHGDLSGNPKIKSIPLTKEVRNGVFGYENIMKLGDESTYLVGTTSGYITVDVNKLQIKDFQVYIGSIVNGSYKNNKAIKNLTVKTLNGDFSSAENNVEISFYTPEFNKYYTPNYQFQLIGKYDDWSEWSKSSSAVFENLPYGNYTFNVRSKIGNTISNNIASYSFKIARPFYISNIMIAAYVLGIVLFSFFMHLVYKRYYYKKQQREIDEMNRKLELEKVKNEKEIIRFKNEQLQEKFNSETKKLADSALSIIKKNELLKTVKDKLNSIENKKSVHPVVNIIDKNLKQNDDWEFFHEAFSNADGEFLRKLKSLHPTLPPNDIKLCSYLRLNLSSKELAKLLNISTRSVEVKRYRLRKRLKLTHKDNLVNYILKL